MDEPDKKRPSQRVAIDTTATTSAHYLKGFRDAINDLTPHSSDDVTSETRHSPTLTATLSGNETATWGLQVTGVLESPFSGKGVRVAALVDGLDTSHPDWSSRNVIRESFVRGESAIEGGQSGTHYLGTAFSSLSPVSAPRYGCAPDANVHVAKVLGSNGSGTLSSILAGLEWAIDKKCRVILMPILLGSSTNDGIMESTTKRAIASGALLISGAGNNARRPTSFGHVVKPAAYQHVISVGTVDRDLHIARFSPRSSPQGTVDFVAPGVDLLSSVPDPLRYTKWSGSATSAAFVAGIASLWAEALPDASATELWQALTSTAQKLEYPTVDMGAGLVKAPPSNVAKTAVFTTEQTKHSPSERPMSKKKDVEQQVVITIDELHSPTIESIASELRSAGLNISNILANSGIVIGSASPETISKLKAIEGVKAIEEDGEMDAN
ncbi:S8 family peptidase [Rhodopirellula baltica]|uniref:Peptidase S8 and S53 subtilisin kexin sedolisin n=1 Tax=Rhodopirellula baltica SWK14 TaxID=993516 RepID=L7CAL7_RHOBT|nr:S8 family serine peptidase [Rhodopirellula baltica]ELP30156.1 peptidase S8 and S53 subtilisin kexin sedolisin [Rhodopirellula baltica SWK14]